MAWEKAVIITGGTAHLGYHAALNTAKTHPTYLVVISSRSDKTQAAENLKRTIDQDNIVFIPLDLSNLSSVRDFATKWAAGGYPPIQYLLLNAGIQHPGKLVKTPDGLESTFAVNHVGPALLFHLLWPHLSKNARVIITASGVHDPAQKSGLPDAIYTAGEDLAHPPASMINIPGRQRYSSSKLANILWLYALDRHLASKKPHRTVTVNAFDPGLMPGTGLTREAAPFIRFLWSHVLPRIIPLLRRVYSPNVHTPPESGKRLARLATDPKLEGITGKYFEGERERSSSEDSYDQQKQENLWQWTVEYLARDAEEQARFDELKI